MKDAVKNKVKPNNTKAKRNKVGNIRAKTSMPDFAQKGIKGFIQDTKLEIQKITWPTKQTVMRASVVVLTIVILSTICVAGLDIVVSRIFLLLRNLV